MTFVTVLGVRLIAREERSADELRVRFKQGEPFPMPVSGFGALLLLVEVRKRHGFELDIAGKRLVGRSHQGVVDVVAVAVQVTEPDRFALALLRAVDRISRQTVLFEPGDETSIFLLIHVVAGRSLIGRRVYATTPHGFAPVRICAPIFYDREGARVHG